MTVSWFMSKTLQGPLEIHQKCNKELSGFFKNVVKAKWYTSKTLWRPFRTRQKYYEDLSVYAIKASLKIAMKASWAMPKTLQRPLGVQSCYEGLTKIFITLCRQFKAAWKNFENYFFPQKWLYFFSNIFNQVRSMPIPDKTFNV